MSSTMLTWLLGRPEGSDMGRNIPKKKNSCWVMTEKCYL